MSLGSPTGTCGCFYLRVFWLIKTRSQLNINTFHFPWTLCRNAIFGVQVCEETFSCAPHPSSFPGEQAGPQVTVTTAPAGPGEPFPAEAPRLPLGCQYQRMWKQNRAKPAPSPGCQAHAHTATPALFTPTRAPLHRAGGAAVEMGQGPSPGLSLVLMPCWGMPWKSMACSTEAPQPPN